MMAVDNGDRDVVDASLLRVPFESLKRAAKERKVLVDEAGEAVAGLSAVRGGELDALDALVARLQGLKRKLADVGRQEAEEAARCRARLAHLHAIGRPPRDGIIPWSKQRLDRILVDHMARSGHQASAVALAQETGSEQLCDLHIFTDAQRVVAALRQRNCAPALAWCAENRARLRRIKSSLELQLRLREFLELVHADRRLDAVMHARRHLAPWASTHMAELQQCLVALAFRSGSKAPRYTAMFEQQQWSVLLELFLRELMRLHCLLPESQLVVHLQAGMIALKTPPGSGGGGSREDPLAHPDLQALAQGLPYAKHVHSKLICAVTRELMSDANPPMVLPNGYVYSQRALEQLVAEHDGRIVCPRTGSSFMLEEARRAFIV